MAKIVIFEKWAVDRVSWSSLVAVGDGLKQRGIEFEYYTPTCFKPQREIPPKADIIFTWGFNYFDIQDYYKNKASIVLVDRGFLRRDHDYRYIVRDNKIPQNKPADRYEKLDISKISTAGRKPKLGHVLICKQNHHEDWYREAIKTIRANVIEGREVRIREYNSEKPLDEDLKNAYAVVSYNSTCLYAAMAQGIPVFCDTSCLASIAAQTDLSIIEKIPGEINYTQFLHNLAYAQWTLKEMRSGDWVEHVLGDIQ